MLYKLDKDGNAVPTKDWTYEDITSAMERRELLHKDIWLSTTGPIPISQLSVSHITNIGRMLLSNAEAIKIGPWGTGHEGTGARSAEALVKFLFKSVFKSLKNDPHAEGSGGDLEMFTRPADSPKINLTATSALALRLGVKL